MISMCFTGHRPKYFNNVLDMSSPIYRNIIKELLRIVEYRIINNNVDTFFTGAQDGIDQIAFFAVQKLKSKYPHIKNKVCVPYHSFRNMIKNKKWYDIMLQQADEVIYVSDISAYSSTNINKQLNNRNEYMVDNSNFVLGVWKCISGGTYNCLQYAKKNNKTINIIYIMDGVNMQITKIDNLGLIDSIVEDLKESMKGKNEDFFIKSLGRLKTLYDEHDKVTLSFNSSSKLEQALSDLKIKEISEENQTVTFEDNDLDIVVTIK